MMVFFEELLNLDRLGHIVVNIIGPPGSGKSAITYDYAAEVLNRRQPVVIAVLDRPPEQIVSRVKELTDIDSSTLDGLLTILDGYSSTVGLETEWKFSFNAGNLSDFSINLSKSLEQKPEAVFIDPLSALVIQHEETPLIKAVQIVMAKLRAGASHSFFTYEEGVHSRVFYNTVRFLGDINLILRREETEKGEVVRALHVHSSKGAPLDERWHPFTIDTQGKIRWTHQDLTQPHTGLQGQ